MPTPLHVLEELRTYLIAQGIAQDWNTSPSATIPGVMLAPRDGAPLPRVASNETATITLRQSGTAQPSPVDAWLETTAVDVYVRCTSAPAGRLIQRAIRGKLAPIGAYQGRKSWDMGSLHVERSFQWRAESEIPVSATAEGQANLTTYDTVQAFMFEVRRTLLEG